MKTIGCGGCLGLALVCALFPGFSSGQQSVTPTVFPSPTASLLAETPPDAPNSDAVTPSVSAVPTPERAPVEAESPAASRTPSPKKIYAGIALAYNFLGGGFDGSKFYVTDASVTLLAPKLDAGLGFNLFGGLVGPKLPAPFGNLVGEIRFNYSIHRWVFQDGQDTSTYYALGVCARVPLSTDFPVKPFAVLGVHYNLLDLKDAAQQPGFITGGASYSGLGLDLGLGASYDLPEGFAVSARALFQPSFTAGGSAFNSSLDQAPGLQGISLQLVTEYYFPDNRDSSPGGGKKEIDWGF